VKIFKTINNVICIVVNIYLLDIVLRVFLKENIMYTQYYKNVPVIAHCPLLDGNRRIRCRNDVINHIVHLNQAATDPPTEGTKVHARSTHEKCQIHADLGQATAREMPVAPMGPEGVGEGGKMVPLPRPWGVLRNGDVEEHARGIMERGSPLASTEKGRLW
jgi:hypothetical protein